MKTRYFTLMIVALLLSTVACNYSPESSMVYKDPLPSWNETSTKQAIIDYVAKVTAQNSGSYIPPEDRIATFDNDGTLWAEQPVVQVEFMFHQIGKLLKENPALAKKQPFKAVANKDTAYLQKMGIKDFIVLMNASQANRLVMEFQTEVEQFVATYKYPKRNSRLEGIRYQPQLELIRYLQDNGFKVYICTGGTADFVRVISKAFYGIEPENVIASGNKYVYKDTTGVNDLFITTEMSTFNDKQAKPVNIMQAIGKRPVLACGNEGGGGDVYMLRYSQGSLYASLQLLVNHDDAVREYEYYEDPDVSLTMAKQHNWTVISMKDDWKVVYAE